MRAASEGLEAPLSRHVPAERAGGVDRDDRASLASVQDAEDTRVHRAVRPHVEHLDVRDQLSRLEAHAGRLEGSEHAGEGEGRRGGDDEAKHGQPRRREEPHQKRTRIR